MSDLLEFVSTPGGSVAVPAPTPPTQPVCPFPRWWYPPESACATTPDQLAATIQDPWFTAPPSTSWGIGSYLKLGLTLGVLLTSVYLGTRLLEAYTQLRLGMTRS